jgi:hypothetical protein
MAFKQKIIFKLNINCFNFFYSTLSRVSRDSRMFSVGIESWNYRARSRLSYRPLLDMKSNAVFRVFKCLETSWLKFSIMRLSICLNWLKYIWLKNSLNYIFKNLFKNIYTRLFIPLDINLSNNNLNGSGFEIRAFSNFHSPINLTISVKPSDKNDNIFGSTSFPTVLR